MAFQRVTSDGSVLDEAHMEMPKSTATAFAIGDVLAWDRSANALVRATSTTDNHGADCYFGVCQSTESASNTTCRVLRFQQGQTYRVDTTNASASSQIGHRYRLTDHANLNNSGTDGTTARDIFEVIKQIGATTDNTVLVSIVGAAGQVTA